MFDHELKIRNKTIKFRKWKVKDKKNFIESIKNDNPEGISNLIYDCIDKPDIALSQEELKYILLNIRAKSLGETLSFNVDCNQCEKEFAFDTNILNTMQPTSQKYKTIKADNLIIKIGEIPNKEYYDDALYQCSTEEQKYLIDFVYHIKEYNGNNGFTFDQVFDFVNNLDIDVGEEVFKQWDSMKFKLNEIITTTCPHCKHEQLVQLDELYGFFPDNWFE
jgi:hypothetical protein